MPKAGYLTPSTFSDLMSNGRGKETMGKTALNIIDNLVLDMLGTQKEETFGGTACQWGLDHEWEARKAYEDETFRMVIEPEFRVSPTHSYVGGTMDGLVGSKGGIEIKCPYNSIEHLYNFTEARQAKTIYKYQLQGYFWIYELEWIDFVSYDPRYPEKQRLGIHRQYPDFEIIESLKKRCELAYEMALDKARKLGA